MASDVLGVSMLVDAINHRKPGKAAPSTFSGRAFDVANPPSIANRGNMAEGCPGIPCFVTGTVRRLNGEPIAGAAPERRRVHRERCSLRREGAAGRRICEEAVGKVDDGRDSLHAILRGEVRLCVAEKGGGVCLA